MTEKQQREVAEARRKEKQKEKDVEKSDKSDEGRKEENIKELGPSVPKRRRIQESVSN